jgi:hypothetical protein
MVDCKPVSTPAIIQKDTQSDDEPLPDQIPFSQVVGELNFLSSCTRPDITYAVSQMARKMHSPSMKDWQNLKRILRYLKGTLHFKLTYSSTEPLVGFSDASYAETEDRRSVSGYVFKMNGAAISWKSRKQPIVSTSSMEAEFIGLSDAIKEGLWLRKLLQELGMNETLIIMEDNQSAIKTASNLVHSERSKHIDVRYHFIREKVMEKQIKLNYCPTAEMTADVFTKPIGKILMERHSRALGLSASGGMLE